jgi:hypothetical protein
MSSLQIIQEELESINNSAPATSESSATPIVHYNGKALDFAQAGWKIMRGKTVYLLRHCAGT